ncbi:transposase [Salimicrobium sp. PL1-032A]|uniref:RNA-guided endonuclease InsQ/TnpB family protein n=1 Tax=Salimicrobium sp. PL1-032A TaxID=3095364 RepID=UPI003260CBE2
MYTYFDEMCRGAKNLYNTVNFHIRQVFTGLRRETELHPLQQEVLEGIRHHLPVMNKVQKAAYEKRLATENQKPEEERKKVTCNLFKAPTEKNPYVDFNFLDAFFKASNQSDYRALPTQTSQSIIRTVFQNWKSFYASLKAYNETPSKFKARPKIPKYSRAEKKEVSFSNQDCVIKNNKFLKFPKTKEMLNIGKLGFSDGKLKQIRVIPKYGKFFVELVFAVPAEQKGKVEPPRRFMGIDTGQDNLATIVTNTGCRPVVVKGTRIKSINQHYNKQKARFTGILRHGKKDGEGQYHSHRLERLNEKRFLQIKDTFHKASRQIIQLAIDEGIDVIVIGKNEDWKQNINIGKKNNQSFVSIPHNLLVQMITYKAEQLDITVITTEESYTSKASLLDEDDLPTYGKTEGKPSFSGQRVKRGLYRSKNGTRINADVNGAGNIIRKVFADAFHTTFACMDTLLKPVSVHIK